MPTKLCFIVGPIGTAGTPVRHRSDFLRRYIINPVMSNRPEYTVVRADEIGQPGMIDKQIITRLRDAELVIADLATSNPNAFYEIGIRHMVGKPIVHMQQNTENIPFDVSLFSAVKYSMESVEDIDRAIAELDRHVQSAIDPEHEIDNPVTRVLGQAQFNQKALPELALIQAELDSLREAINPVLEDRRRASINRVAAALLGPPGTAGWVGQPVPSTTEPWKENADALAEALKKIEKGFSSTRK